MQKGKKKKQNVEERIFALIIPSANTVMSLSLAAFTMHTDPCLMQYT